MVPPEIFRRLALFADFSDQELEKLSRLFQEREYGSGEIIAPEGGVREEVVILLEGSVSVEMTSSLQGRAEPLVIATESTPGRIIEWSSEIDAVKGGGSALLRAIDPARVLVASGREVKDLCDGEPTLGYKFIQQIVLVISSRLGDTRNQFLSVCSQFWWPENKI